METIKIEIGTDGGTQVSVKGVKGKGCEALTKGIEEALGGVADRMHTPEYNQQAAATNKAVAKQ
jgi:hypothetical protein